MITRENTSTGPRLVKTSAGSPGKYIEISLGDTARGFTSSEMLDSNGNPPVYAFMEVSDNSMRFTYDSDNLPTTAGVGLRLQTSETWELLGYEEIAAFQFVNETAGSAATLKVQFWY